VVVYHGILLAPMDNCILNASKVLCEDARRPKSKALITYWCLQAPKRWATASLAEVQPKVFWRPPFSLFQIMLGTVGNQYRRGISQSSDTTSSKTTNQTSLPSQDSHTVGTKKAIQTCARGFLSYSPMCRRSIRTSCFVTNMPTILPAPAVSPSSRASTRSRTLPPSHSPLLLVQNTL
jgi:hypothetical protein